MVDARVTETDWAGVKSIAVDLDQEMNLVRQGRIFDVLEKNLGAPGTSIAVQERSIWVL